MAKKRAAKKAKKSSPKTISMDKLMAAWQAAMTPGEGHRRLEPMAGTWRATTTFLMAPGAEPHVSEGTSEHRFILGGRYLEQVYSGSSMGMPFEGRGYTGYDNVKKRYVGTWMDTFGTGLMTSVGKGRPTAARMAFVAEAFEPSGKRIVFDAILRIRDRDHHSYEMWTKAPNGKRYRNMLVEYVRV